MKSAYYDPNPVVMLEHKGLYWSKIKGTENAKTIEPDADYIIPFGKARTVIQAEPSETEKGTTLTIITYGMGVYWATNAAKKYQDRIEVIDLRTLYPLDEEAMYASVRKHGRAMVVTEEPRGNGFAQSIAARISKNCFEYLDAAVEVVGAENMPAIPLNSTLEETMIPSIGKVSNAINALLDY